MELETRRFGTIEVELLVNDRPVLVDTRPI